MRMFAEQQMPQQRGAPNAVDAGLRTPNRPLDRHTRAFFENRFGHNFGHVRVHTDDRAANSAGALHARAYTVGSDKDSGSGAKGDTPAPVPQDAGPKAATKKSITVNVTFLEGGSTSLATHLTKANAVYKPADVEVKSGKSKTLDASQSKKILGDDLILDEYSDPKKPTTEEQALIKENRVAGELTMYYVKGMSQDSVGENFRDGNGQPPGFVFASDNSRTWPHEMGHVLLNDGNHPSDNDNFMAQTADATGKDLMTADQVSKIRASKYVK